MYGVTRESRTGGQDPKRSETAPVHKRRHNESPSPTGGKQVNKLQAIEQVQNSVSSIFSKDDVVQILSHIDSGNTAPALDGAGGLSVEFAGRVWDALYSSDNITPDERVIVMQHLSQSPKIPKTASDNLNMVLHNIRVMRNDIESLSRPEMCHVECSLEMDSYNTVSVIEVCIDATAELKTALETIKLMESTMDIINDTKN